MELGLGELAVSSQLPLERKPRDLHTCSRHLWSELYLSGYFISPDGASTNSLEGSKQ